MEEDKELIERVKTGDYGAFEELVRKHRKRAYSIARRIVNCHFDADDIVQEAFLQVYQHIQKFKGKSSFSTWLYRIVVNLSLNLLKSRSRREMMNLEDANEEIDEETPAHIVEKEELKTLVKQAVNSLPHYQRIVVELHEFEGLSDKEIAEILNCSEGTVWSRLHRARERLKKMLAPYLEK